MLELYATVYSFAVHIAYNVTILLSLFILLYNVLIFSTVRFAPASETEIDTPKPSAFVFQPENVQPVSVKPLAVSFPTVS